MKKLLCLILAIIFIPGGSFSESLSPETVIYLMNSLSKETELDGFSTLYYYDNQTNTFGFKVFSENIITPAKETLATGEATEEWLTCEEAAFSMYESLRPTLSDLGFEDYSFHICFVTSMEKNGVTFYIVGDEKGKDYRVIKALEASDKKALGLPSDTSPSFTAPDGKTYCIDDSMTVILKDAELSDLFLKAVKKFDFTSALNYVSKYKEKNKQDDLSGISNYLDQLLAEANRCLQNCIVEYDPVEEKVKVFFHGVEKIDKDTCLVPYIDNGSRKEIFGFIAEDWIFTDTIIINGNGMDKINWFVKDVQRDVLKHGKITEYYYGHLDDSECTSIHSAEDVIIRFRNSDTDKKYDHKVSQAEADALNTIRSLHSIYLDISNLCFRFQKACE